MGGKLERYFIPAVVAFAPLVTFLMTWDAASHGKLVSIIRGLSLPEIGAELVIISIAFAEGMARWLKQIRPNLFALTALITLVVIAIGTIGIAPDKFEATSRTIFWITHLGFGFSIMFLCGKAFDPGEFVRTYIWGFVAFAAAFAVFVASMFHQQIDWTRDLPAVVHIRHLGIYATAIIGLCVGRMATTVRRDTWVFAFAAAVCGFALALWTGARGPVFAVAAAVVIGMIVSPATRQIKAWGGALAAAGTALLAVAWLPAPASNMGVGRTIAATTRSADVGTGRLAMWKGVIQAIEHQPLFGYGAGQMSAVAPFYDMMQPHNLVLQILLDWGISGLLCCTVLSLWFVSRAIPAVRSNEAQLLAPLLAMAALFALSMIDAALYHVLPVSIFAACAGMIAAGWRMEAHYR